MDTPHVTRRPDPVLLPYLEAASEVECRQRLSRLIREHAEPVVHAIVRQRWRAAPRRTDGRRRTADDETADDVCGEALARLVTRLNACRLDPSSDPITDFRGYVAVTTYRVCNDYLRTRYPRRWSLKNQLRYLLTHRPGFALWEQSDTLLCGFATWKESGRPPASPDRVQSLRDRPHLALGAGGLNPQHDDPTNLMEALLNYTGAPIELEDVVAIFADLLEVRDPEPETQSAEEGREPPWERAADPHADVATEVDRRVYLQWLWTEIRQLPPRQAAALLLNLRDSRGRGVIALLPLQGIASLRQIADVLGMGAEEFARVWKDLPMEDAAIAALLGITRQQVINLRKVGRERLARRARSLEAPA